MSFQAPLDTVAMPQKSVKFAGHIRGARFSRMNPKLRRLADALETEQAFEIQVAGQRLYVPAGAHFSVEHERSGDTDDLEFQVRW